MTRRRSLSLLCILLFIFLEHQRIASFVVKPMRRAWLQQGSTTESNSNRGNRAESRLYNSKKGGKNKFAGKPKSSASSSSGESGVASSVSLDVKETNALPKGTELDSNRDETTAVKSSSSSSSSSPLSSSSKSASTPPRTRLERSMSIDINKPLRVPRTAPLDQTSVPPEVVFFGDPRRPPPIELCRDSSYWGTLLLWCRHCTVAPVTSEDRLETVFCKGSQHPNAASLRLNTEGLTYEKIHDAFNAVSDNFQMSKDFIEVNADMVHPRMFLRALTGKKLLAQSQAVKNPDMAEEMDRLKGLRQKYILAYDQLFFPLNIEMAKAETRVMAYMSRPELRQYARSWDEVEVSLHMLTLVASRLVWDDRVNFIKGIIENKLNRTIEYMQKAVQRNFVDQYLTQPAITGQVYLNASMQIEQNMPELYARIKPEVKVLYETYFMQDSTAIRDYITNKFCPNNGITLDSLKEKLKILESMVAALESQEYFMLGMRFQTIREAILTDKEKVAYRKWYDDLKTPGKGWGFQTYQVDTIPGFVEYEQRVTKSENEFDNFAIETLNMPTKFDTAFSGVRPKASDVGNWLEIDPEYTVKAPQEVMEKFAQFRNAYMVQCAARKEAEMELVGFVSKRMEFQDSALLGEWGQRVLEINDPRNEQEELESNPELRNRSFDEQRQYFKDKRDREQRRQDELMRQSMERRSQAAGAGAGEEN